MFRIRNETLAANHGFFLNMVLRYMHQDTSKRYSDSGQGIVIFENTKKKRQKIKKYKNGGENLFFMFLFFSYVFFGTGPREGTCVCVCLCVWESLNAVRCRVPKLVSD